MSRAEPVVRVRRTPRQGRREMILKLVTVLERRFAVAAIIAVGLGAALLHPKGSAAQEAGDLCLTSEPPPISAPPHGLRFGITPHLAGSAGIAQGTAIPEDPTAAREALRRLRVRHRALVLRLNRLFSAAGETGIRRFVRLARRYARAGFQTEVQVRYHPRPDREGNIAAWTRFVRDAVQALGRIPSVVAFSITNEANLPLSPNTSDGSFERAPEALVRGIVAARRAAAAIARPDIPLGFTVAWRYLPNADAAFWSRLGALATREFRRALTYVGVQLYPGLFWPPIALPGRSAGEETIEALTLVRRCHMPKAGLGRRVELWVTENGYSTRPVLSSSAAQAADLASTVGQIRRNSGTLGVTDYRYFNLRDNDSAGIDLFDQVGLLRDDYTPKPAFYEYRDLIRRFGREG